MPQVSYRIFSLGWGGGGGGGTLLWQGGLNENPDDDKYGSSEACSSPRLLPEAIPFEGCSSVSLTTKALRKKGYKSKLTYRKQWGHKYPWHLVEPQLHWVAPPFLQHLYGILNHCVLSKLQLHDSSQKCRERSMHHEPLLKAFQTLGKLYKTYLLLGLHNTPATWIHEKLLNSLKSSPIFLHFSG